MDVLQHERENVLNGVHLAPHPPTLHLTAGADFFSFDLASAGLNEGIILGPRTLCLIPGGPASGGGSAVLPPSGRRMLQVRNQWRERRE